MYADNAITLSEAIVADLETQINSELEYIDLWLKANKLSLNGCGHTTELNRDLASKSRLKSKHDLAYNRDLKYFWSH